ncbi:MAG TPA: IS256 family transposase [Ignavibacteria bacterium]
MELTNVQKNEIILELLSKEGGINSLLSIILNNLMKAERDIFLNTQRSSNNKGNGYRLGFAHGYGTQIELRIPRDRLSEFYPVILALIRDQEELTYDLCFELYSKGLTTREIGDILEIIYGKHYSKSNISRINKSFYEEMEQWRNRTLEARYLVVYIDAIVVKVKRESIKNESFYIVMGLTPEYKREILAIECIPQESAKGWEEVLSKLKDRGVNEIELFVTDGLKSIEMSINKVFPKSSHQKCTVHLKRNILSYVRKEHKKEILDDMNEVLNPDEKTYTKEKAMKQLSEFSKKWGKYYKYIRNLPQKEGIENYFTYLEYDYRIRRMIYTTNWIERFNKSCRRTLKIRNSFPSPEAALAIITSVAIDKENKSYNYSIINFKFEPKFV